jgi:molybdopterin-guanine dinucleotide biosynthesis protein A
LSTSGIILAGGKSLRLGHNKVFETIGHKNLLDLVVEWVAPLTDEVILVITDERAVPQHINHSEFKVVTDIYPGKGPLGGIYTGLVHSSSFKNLVVASDMPFLNQALLRYMIQIAAGFDVVVPRVGHLVEPLHSVYSKNCAAPIKQMIDKGRLSVSQLLSQVRTRYLEAAEIERFDPQHLSFFNVNTIDDLRRAREIARKMQP